MPVEQPRAVLTSDIYRVTVHSDFAARSARAVVAMTLGRPRLIVIYVGLVLASLGLGLLGAGPFGSGWLGGAAALALLYLATLLGAYLRQRHVSSSLIPEGTELASQFGPTHFWFSTFNGEGTVRYDVFKEMRVKNGIVLLIGRGASSYLPMELFPDGWLDYVSKHLSRA